MIILLFLIGCSANIIYHSKGEELYNSKCGGCHRIYNKAEFNPEQWKTEVEEMSKKAKLTNDESKLILDFLTDKQVSKKLHSETNM